MTLGVDWNLLKMTFLGVALICTLFLLIFSSQYRRFNLDEFVIHLRNGKIWREGTGDHAIRIPFIDKIITIPLGKLGIIAEETNFDGGAICVETSPPLDEILLSARTRSPNDIYLKGVPIVIIEFEDDICVVKKASSKQDKN